jgi:hypothetical protein
VIEAPDAPTFVIRGSAIMELARPIRVARVDVFRAGDLRAPSVCPCHIPGASATIGVIDKTNSLDVECLEHLVVRLRGRVSGLSRLPN